MSTKPRSIQITFYTRDPGRLAKFWSSALGFIEEAPPPGFETWEAFARENNIPEEDWNALSALVHPEGSGPRILFHRVKKPKQAKNYLHLDVTVPDLGKKSEEERKQSLREEAARLETQGATLLREIEERGEFWIAMADPDRNEFCLQ